MAGSSRSLRAFSNFLDSRFVLVTGDILYFYTPPLIVHVKASSLTAAKRPPAQIVQPLGYLLFGGHTHVADSPGRLAQETNYHCLKLHFNYQHRLGFSEVYREAYSLLDSVKSVGAKEHQSDRDSM